MKRQKKSAASLLMSRFNANPKQPKHFNQADANSVVIYGYVVQKLTEFFIKNRFRAHTLNYEFPVCSWETPFFQADLYRKLRVHCRSKHEHLNNVLFIFSVDKDITPEDYEAMLNKVEELYCSEVTPFMDLTSDKRALPETHRLVRENLPRVMEHFDETVRFTADWKLEAEFGKPYISMRVYNVIDRNLVRQIRFDLKGALNANDEGYLEAMRETIANEIFEALTESEELIYVSEVIEHYLGNRVDIEKLKQ